MFDPNQVCKPNGQYFGFPFRFDESKLILMAVPWDVTTSYQAGTAKGPLAILEASYMMDFFDTDIPQAWNLGIGTFPFSNSEGVALSSRNLRPLAEGIIHCLINEDANEENTHDLLTINQASEMLNDWVYENACPVLDKGKKIGLVGGEHSVPLGLIKALGERHKEFGILHIDAHADLREAYEGFTYSHASIMYNVLQNKSVSALVQVGIRDYCAEEALRASSDTRIIQFPDSILQKEAFEGLVWAEQCRRILESLPQKVYICFDIDGLTPDNCPHTGTPVPGGLSYAQAIYLLKALWKSGREIIGFDLCEVAPDPSEQNDWDANVGARILYTLSNICLAKN